jgi:hypothetical protein
MNQDEELNELLFCELTPSRLELPRSRKEPAECTRFYLPLDMIVMCVLPRCTSPVGQRSTKSLSLRAEAPGAGTRSSSDSTAVQPCVGTLKFSTLLPALELHDLRRHRAMTEIVP